MTAIQIRSDKVRLIITGSATPAWDLSLQWPDLTDDERYEAAAYYRSVSSLMEHAAAERAFVMDNDL